MLMDFYNNNNEFHLSFYKVEIKEKLMDIQCIQIECQQDMKILINAVETQRA